MRDRLVGIVKRAAYSCLPSNTEDFHLDRFVTDLLANGVIVPTVKVGDTVYFLIEYDDSPELPPGIEAAKVTEVGTRGFFTSAFIPPQDDMGDFTPWSELGKTVFLREEDALPLLKRT